MDAFDLWGENESNRRELQIIEDTKRAYNPRCGAWYYSDFVDPGLMFVPFPATFPVAELRLSQGLSWANNTTYSVCKVTYVCSRRVDVSQDHYLVNANYGNGTIFGKDMVMNSAPSTASTNSTYALYTDDPNRITLVTANTRVGKTSNPSSAWRRNGQFQIVLWHNGNFHVVRVNERTYA